MVLLKRGDAQTAKALFEEHLAEYQKNPRNPGHGPYVRDLAWKLGLGELG
jgi:hypothetical protein